MHHLMQGLAIDGWVRAHGGSIGSAASGATERANADTLALYVMLWENWSANITVDGGAGSTAEADFAANKKLTLPDLRGQVVAAKTTAGTFGGDLGASIGAEGHTLTEAELPVIAAHQHSAPFSTTNFGVLSGGDLSVPNEPTSGTTEAAGGFGGGGSHNNVQPTRLVGSIYLKL